MDKRDLDRIAGEKKNCLGELFRSRKEINSKEFVWTNVNATFVSTPLLLIKRDPHQTMSEKIIVLFEKEDKRKTFA